MAQTQILETDKQVTVDQAIENYKRELDATGEDLTVASCRRFQFHQRSLLAS